MKKIIAIFVLAVMAMMINSCGCESFEEVPEKTERIILKRPHDYFNRKAGVEVATLNTGKRNHGAGPCASYDVSTSIQSQVFTVNVKTADNINIPITLDVGYRAISGKGEDLVMNYMPPVNTGSGIYIPSSYNSVEVIKVPLDKIFLQNIYPYADEVARDVIDSYRSKDIKIGELIKNIKFKLIDRLKKHNIPKVEFAGGSFSYPVMKEDGTWDGPSICIADCIEIVRVNVKEYKNPPFINNIINGIETEKAGVKERQSELEQWKIKKKIRVTEAQHARKTALNIKKMLKLYPHMMKLRKLKNLENIERNAQPGDNTVIYFVPENMMSQGLWEIIKQREIAEASKK